MNIRGVKVEGNIVVNIAVFKEGGEFPSGWKADGPGAVMGATDNGDGTFIPPAPEPKTPEEIAEQAKSVAALARANNIAAIKVIAVQGKEFSGNEAEQARLAVAITLLDPGESIDWVLTDETVVSLTREELKEVLVAVGRMAAAIRASGR